MPRKNKIILRTGSGAPTAGDFVAGEPAWDSANGKLYLKNAAGSMVEIAGGGGGSAELVYTYATTSLFPATGSTSLLYIATDSGRLYRWDGTVYVELGPVGGAAEDAVLRAFFTPAAPTNVAGSSGNASVVVSWTAPTVVAQIPVTDYLVQYSANSGSTWTTFSDGVSTATSATVTGLTNGTSYLFRVAAVSSLAQSAWSSASASVAPADVLAISYLIVGGGGSGAKGTPGVCYGGGGGGGGVQSGTANLSNGSYAVTVGNGGAGSSSTGSSANGQSSVFNSVTAGGGLGGSGTGVGTGGTSGSPQSRAAATGSANPSSGGAGSGATSSGTTGGAGTLSAITGSNVYYGGGGGGSGDASSGTGGTGGGGTGASAGNTPTSGGANTGGGGGSMRGDDPYTAGSGGSGVVIISYLTADATGRTISGGTTTTSGSYTIRTFASSGTFSLS